MNQYRQPFASFIQRITTLNGTHHIVECELDKIRQSLVTVVSSSVVNAPAVWSVSRIPMFDLTAPKKDQGKLQFVTPTFTATNDAYIDTLDDFLRRMRATTIAQAFEVFETFVMDSVAIFLLAHPDKAGPGQITKFEQQRLSESFSQGDLEYWKRFVRAMMRGADKALQKLRAVAAAFRNGEQNNAQGIDLSIWFKAMYEVRHAAVHADCIIKPNRLIGWSLTDVDMLHSAFRCQLNGDQHHVSLTMDQTKIALEMLCEYGLHIFKCLSIAEGFGWKADLAGVLVHE